MLHNDNVREYVSHSFKSFMGSHGILHQTLCAYINVINVIGLAHTFCMINLYINIILYVQHTQGFYPVFLFHCFNRS